MNIQLIVQSHHGDNAFKLAQKVGRGRISGVYYSLNLGQ